MSKSCVGLQIENTQLKKILGTMKREALVLERNAVEDVGSMNVRIGKLVDTREALIKTLTEKAELILVQKLQIDSLVADNEVLAASSEILLKTSALKDKLFRAVTSRLEQQVEELQNEIKDERAYRKDLHAAMAFQVFAKRADPINP